MSWEAIAILFVILVSVVAITGYVISEFFASRRIRRGFKLTLARFSTWEWMRHIGRAKTKRLTYRPDPEE